MFIAQLSLSCGMVQTMHNKYRFLDVIIAHSFSKFTKQLDSFSLILLSHSFHDFFSVCSCSIFLFVKMICWTSNTTQNWKKNMQQSNKWIGKLTIQVWIFLGNCYHFCNFAKNLEKPVLKELSFIYVYRILICINPNPGFL